MLPLLLLPLLIFHFSCRYNDEPTQVGSGQNLDYIIETNPRVVVPNYVRLQALQKGNVTFWESMPRNFSDHVAEIGSRVLAMFVSSNSLGFNLSRDSVGNLWMAANYSLNVGDYIGTLTWVSSKTTSENLSSFGFVSFPHDYPDDIGIFLEAGTKMPSEDLAIQAIASNYNKTQNMTQTVESVLEFVYRQGYDREKSRLLLSGNLNTTDVLGFFKDALQTLETNSSMCLERSWYAAAILRAAGVPARTVTDFRLKTWIQVWLPGIGWVDAEALCVEPPPQGGVLPKSVSTHVPWMVENSSDASFPFTWLPKVQMRVANLTFSEVQAFDISQFGTVLSEPVEAALFSTDPTKFMFPIVFKPEIVYAAVTEEASGLTFSLFKGQENASRVLALGESNSIVLGDVAVSFKPVRQETFLILQDFAVQEVWRFDTRLLVPIVGVPVVAAVALLYFKMARKRR